MKSDSGRKVYDQILEQFSQEDPRERAYVQLAAPRMWATLEHLPRGEGGKRLLDIGSFKGLLAPVYVEAWGYKEVALLGYDVPPEGELRRAGAEGKTYAFKTHAANIELEPFPIPDESFDTVVCTDVFEHLIFDPVFAMNEISRVLVPGGHALIAVPNAVSDECLTFLVNNSQPGFLRHYISDALRDGSRDLGTVYNLGHFHEYTAPELKALATACGFRTEALYAFDYREPQLAGWRFSLLRRLVSLLFPRSPRLHGEEMVGLFVKESYTPLHDLSNRYPAPLYRPMSAVSH